MPRREVAMGHNKVLSDLERVLLDHGANPQLESLVTAGCSRAALKAILELSFLTDESWKTLVGTSLRGFKVAIKQIRHCAGLIERLDRSDLMYRVSIELRDPRFAEVHRSPSLPERLREYAKTVDSLTRTFGPKHKVTKHFWKARLVATVLEQTGKAHDPEVSSLIAAVLNDDDYSEKAHQAWRLKHGPLIENERLRERARRCRSSHSN
jgi:hypothetical protein